MVEGGPHVCHMCHVWQLTCTLLLYGGGGPHVCHMCQLMCVLDLDLDLAVD